MRPGQTYGCAAGRASDDGGAVPAAFCTATAVFLLRCKALASIALLRLGQFPEFTLLRQYHVKS